LFQNKNRENISFKVNYLNQVKQYLMKHIFENIEQHTFRSKYGLMKLLCLLPVLAATYSVSGQSLPGPSTSNNFIGAELIGNVTAPGKIKITLRAFYSIAQSAVNETEAVSIIGGGKTNITKGAELKKEGEYIDVKYPIVAGSNEKIPPAVKSVTYTTVVDMGSIGVSYDIVWMHTGLPVLINNVEFRSGDAISLTVHIDDARKAINNTSPMLVRLPVFKVGSNTKTTSPMNVQDNDKTDKVEVVLSAPIIYHASQKGAKPEKGFAVKGGVLTEATYRKGFSADKPLAAACTYNKESGELVFERPAFGNYLCAVTITDFRNQKPLSNHQAIFFIASIL
jgi:hypothetical protein